MTDPQHDEALEVIRALLGAKPDEAETDDPPDVERDLQQTARALFNNHLRSTE